MDDSDDIHMSHWTGTIIGPSSTCHDGRIYCVKLNCGPQYPDQPPTLKFQSKINMTCVSQSNGTVDPRHFAVLNNWNRNYTIETILTELRKEMASPANRKLPQP